MADRDSHPSSIPPRSAWLVAIVAVAAIAATLFAVLGRQDVNPGGPVGLDAAFSTGAPVDAKQLIATAAPEAYNRGSETAVLEAIGLVDPPPGLRVVKTYILGPKHMGPIPQMTNWPDPDFGDLHPVSGYRVPPESTRTGKLGIRLVFVMRIAEAKLYQVRGTWIRYRVGDQRYRARLRSGLALCADSPPKPRCALPRDI